MNFAKRTYLLNILQVFSMGVFSFFVPLIIGMEEYGKYVVLFVLPGIAGAIVETNLVINYNREKNILFFMVIFSLLFFISGVKYGFHVAVFEFILFYFLILKSFFYSILVNVKNNNIFYITTLLAELSVGVIYILLCIVFYALEVGGFVLPILMVSMGCLAYALTVFIYLRKNGVEYSFGYLRSTFMPSFDEFFRFMYLRSYEDFYFTILPAVFSLWVSNVLGGQYKVITSVIKLGIKLYPLRYETISFYKSRSAPKKSLLFFVFVSIFSSFVICFLVNLPFVLKIIELYQIDYNFFQLVIVTPFIAFLVAWLPVQLAEKNYILPFVMIVIMTGHLLCLRFFYDYFFHVMMVSNFILFLYGAYCFFMIRKLN